MSENLTIYINFYFDQLAFYKLMFKLQQNVKKKLLVNCYIDKQFSKTVYYLIIFVLLKF